LDIRRAQPVGYAERPPGVFTRLPVDAGAAFEEASPFF
jgi:hypothetical protein